MRTFLYSLLAIVVVALSACSGGKKLPAVDYLAEANGALAIGDSAAALSKFVAAQQAGVQFDSVSCRAATIVASSFGKDSLAVNWGTRFSSKGDKGKSAALYKSLVNLSKPDEVYALVSADRALFVGILGEQPVLKHEVAYYAEYSDSRLLESYPKLSGKDAQSKYFAAYFGMAKGKVDDADLLKVCKRIVKMEDNVNALEFVGRQTYESAEARYVKAMTEYNKKRTQAAHAYLSRDLKKVISPMYRESRDCYEKLHSLNPSNETYVKYLINIYERLENKSKVSYYKKKLK